MRRRSLGTSAAGFESAGARERRQADLFLADLLGYPPPRRRRERPSEAWSGGTAEPETALEDVEGAPWENAEGPPDDAQSCGVFPAAGGPAIALRVVREAVVARAGAESAAWHTPTPRATLLHLPRLENEPAMFGHLVSYYLAANAGILPDTLAALGGAATGGIKTFAPLLAAGLDAAGITREVGKVKTALLAPVSNPPGDLAGLVDTAIRNALQSRDESGGSSDWGAVWVSAVVRRAAIELGVEAAVPPGPRHLGRDQLLKVALSDTAYTLEARRRRKDGVRGTYHAFTPAERTPQLGDIIVQDRRPDLKRGGVTKLADLKEGLISHGDIVTSVRPGFVETLGGDVCSSVRLRRFPLDQEGFLAVDRLLLYAQEDGTGKVGLLPQHSCRGADQPLDDRSTARVFALLSLVEECRLVRDVRNIA